MVDQQWPTIGPLVTSTGPILVPLATNVLPVQCIMWADLGPKWDCTCNSHSRFPPSLGFVLYFSLKITTFPGKELRPINTIDSFISNQSLPTLNVIMKYRKLKIIIMWVCLLGCGCGGGGKFTRSILKKTDSCLKLPILSWWPKYTHAHFKVTQNGGVIS